MIEIGLNKTIVKLWYENENLKNCLIKIQN